MADCKEGQLLKPQRRPIASASTRVRRRWAVHEIQWMALTVLTALVCFKFYCSALLSPWSAVWAGACVFLGTRIYRQALRLRTILRGRGRPRPSVLIRETNNVSSFISVFIFMGLLAAVAIPKFADLVRVGTEGATKGNLGAIRSALSIYYGDTEGNYPSHLDALLVGGKYLSQIPQAKPERWHSDSNHVVLGSSPTDVGGWLYDPKTGTLLVNCTHEDRRGNVWTSY